MKFTALITWLSTCAYQVLRSPLHLKKAKPLIDGSSELLNTKEDESAENQPKPQPRGRRSPDLKKKRQILADAGTSGVRRSQRIRSRPLKFWKGERFSLKPDTSQPSTTLEPSFQYDQLQNPEILQDDIRNPYTQDSEQESVILNDSQDEKFADAGTSSKSGVRRSQRIRSRPLKFWKGERFLHGKVNNNSRPAVIGLKYIPNGKSDLKVVLFDSNEHKEQLDFAALP